MGLFDKMKEPVFLKESSDAEVQLERLKAMEPLLNAEGQGKLKQNIKYLEYGIVGEKNIAFELKNSHMPIYILHDICLAAGDLNAQIDYLVFTRKICFVIECKNLYGDIEINNRGDFIRTMEFGGRKKKEGIYSPITQNQRHLDLIEMISNQNNSIFTQFLAKNSGGDSNKSVVVLSNPRTVLNAKFAKKEVKEKVIRADQLISYMKDIVNKSNRPDKSDKQLLEQAQSYLALHKEAEKDYTTKYEPYFIKNCESKEKETVKAQELGLKAEVATKAEPELKEIPAETDVLKALKEFRLNKSREEKIKPYYIYNDSQLNDLISKKPKSIEDLKKVSGFGEVKANKYGTEIIHILIKYVNFQ